eukprot:COSAG02_NODE_3634_length_6446_cov_3.541201_6_plen_160_part_00
MQRTPLHFVGDSSLRWGGPGGRQLFFNGTDITEGVTPSGSMWRMNPIPRNDPYQTGEGFAPVCDWPHNSGTGSDQGEVYPCQGGQETGLGNLEIVDRVKIPSDLPPGNYVVGWRELQSLRHTMPPSCYSPPIIASAERACNGSRLSSLRDTIAPRRLGL